MKKVEVINFKSFMDGSFKASKKKHKEVNLYSVGLLGPGTFLNMPPSVTSMYVGLSVLGAGAVSMILLERYLVNNEHYIAASIISTVLTNGFRIGGISFIIYTLVRLVWMF